MVLSSGKGLILDAPHTLPCRTKHRAFVAKHDYKKKKKITNKYISGWLKQFIGVKPTWVFFFSDKYPHFSLPFNFLVILLFSG